MVDNRLTAFVAGTEEKRAELQAAPHTPIQLSVDANCAVGELKYAWNNWSNGVAFLEKDGSACAVEYLGVNARETVYCTVSDAFGSSVEISFVLNSKNGLYAKAVGDTTVQEQS